MAEKTELIKALDNMVFKMLFRTLKEVNYSYITTPSTDTSNSIKEECYKIRRRYKEESYFENIYYWPSDLGMGLEVKLLFLSRVVNLINKTSKGIFKKDSLTDDLKSHGIETLFRGIYDTISYLAQATETTLRDLTEIKEAIEFFDKIDIEQHNRLKLIKDFIKTIEKLINYSDKIYY